MERTTALSRFFDACVSGDLDASRRLLDEDGSLARATDPRAPHPGLTGLHVVARCGHVDAARLLLERGANPNAREAGDNTYPLHQAAAHEQPETVRVLLDAGGDVHGFGDVHALDVIGWATFFHAPGDDPAAFSERRTATVALLLERGARHHIFSAMSIGDLDLIRRLVEQHPGALERRMSRFEQGMTPLHFALSRHRYDILDLLIECGSDLEAEDSSGQTALAVAMLRGDVEAMRRLHAAGAKPPSTIGPSDFAASIAGMSASVGKAVPMLVAPDVGRTLDWYTSIGFEELARYEDDGVVNFGMVSFGKAEVMLNRYGRTGGHDLSVWFYTDRVDDLYRVLKARQLEAARAELEGEPGDHAGIPFQQEIADMFYGARQFGIRDPNGYILYFIQSIEQ